MNKEGFSFQNSGEETFGILRIGVDLDETVIGLVAQVRKPILEKLGVDVFQSDSFDFRQWSKIKAVPDGPKFIEDLFKSVDYYREARPIENAVEYLNKWRGEGHQIWFITARTERLRAVTFGWLADNQLAWAQTRTVFRSAFNDDRILFKSKNVANLRLHVFIEDQAEAVKKATSLSMMVKLVLKYPWNWNEEIGDQAKFVSNWREIDQIVQETSRQHRQAHDLYIA